MSGNTKVVKYDFCGKIYVGHWAGGQLVRVVNPAGVDIDLRTQTAGRIRNENPRFKVVEK